MAELADMIAHPGGGFACSASEIAAWGRLGMAAALPDDHAPVARLDQL
ncbi:MAG: hypothetical protein M3O34_01235 [Chloroflexota bacterium]|nr:hypothetical protein [Chloroflexota bacterium]